MNTSTRKIFYFSAAILVMMVGVIIGRWSADTGSVSPMDRDDDAPQHEQTVLYWYDPMQPQQHFDQPGPSPFMDMDLVPRYADSGKSSDEGILVDASVVQNLGMRTAPVETVRLSSQLDLTGQIVFNERAITRLQSRRAAFVEQVWPLAEGDQVVAGQPLVRLRVPEWVTAQHELLALKNNGDVAMLRAGEEHARSLGMPNELIQRVKKSAKVDSFWRVRAPHAGVIRKLDVRAGMVLSAGAALAQINGLDSVWLDIAVPQAQIKSVAVGDIVEVYLDGIEPAERQGKVAEILPLLNQDRRNVSVRVELKNKHGDLRPGLSARVRLRGEAAQSVLVVPTEALLRTGLRTLVMVREDTGRFRPVEVRPGVEFGESTVIEAGLNVGQLVVTSGQFLLDSEASMQGIAVKLLDENAAEHSPIKNPSESEALTHNHGADTQLIETHPVDLHYADAIVEAISTEKVTLTHGPFTSLSMPGMTMRFLLARETLADNIRPGDPVRVGLRKVVEENKTSLIVEVLEKRSADGGASQ